MGIIKFRANKLSFIIFINVSFDSSRLLEVFSVTWIHGIK